MSDFIKPISFKNVNNKVLHGILRQPQEPRQDIGIIFLSPGIKNRVGPHRLYVKMAEHFNELGFTVLKVDPEGLGDSEGDISEEMTADVYASIQLGRYIEDTKCMMDWMEKEVKVSRFILAGLCGGAITALLTSEKDYRIGAILSLGIPCILASSAIDPTKYITEQQLSSIREKYIAKLTNPQAWVRLFSFKSDYKLMIRSLFQLVKKDKQKNEVCSVGDHQINQIGSHSESNLNPHFHRAFLKFISKNKILLVFSGADRLYWEFEEKYLKKYKNFIEPYNANYHMEIINEANHVLSFTEWQKDLQDITENWLKSVAG